MTDLADDFGQGATIEANGVRFRLWAPGCDQLDLALEPEKHVLQMEPQAGGFFELFVPSAGAGTLYRYRLPDGRTVPDPASRFQPQDVHGPSEVIDSKSYT